MAPALSKGDLPLPRTTAELAAQFSRKVGPALEELLDEFTEFFEDGSCTAKRAISETLDRIAQKASEFCAKLPAVNPAKCLLGSSDSKRTPLADSLPLYFVLQIIAMLYSAFVFCYMPAAGIGFHSSTSLLFHAIVFLILASFAQAARTDPGGIPASAAWRTKGSPPSVLKELKSKTGTARWCTKAAAYKPDRAHNCKALKKCVLRMDHNCPWIGNTVGFHNHKFFFLFLLYINSACGMLGVGIFELLLHCVLPPLTTFVLIGAEALVAILASVLTPFFLFHVYLLVNNLTTIEYREKVCKDSGDVEAGAGEPWSNPYDIGLFWNVCEVMGNNPLLWFLPFGGASGDGLSFPTNEQPSAEPFRCKRSAKSPMGKGGSKDSATPTTTAGAPSTPSTDVGVERHVFAEDAQRLPGHGELESLSEEEGMLNRHECARRDVEVASDDTGSVEIGEGDIDEAVKVDQPEDDWSTRASLLLGCLSSSCQAVGESVGASVGHVKSIFMADGRAKRTSLRRSFCPPAADAKSFLSACPKESVLIERSTFNVEQQSPSMRCCEVESKRGSAIASTASVLSGDLSEEHHDSDWDDLS